MVVELDRFPVNTLVTFARRGTVIDCVPRVGVAMVGVPAKTILLSLGGLNGYVVTGLPEESVNPRPLGTAGYVKVKLDDALGGIAVKVTGVIGTPTVSGKVTGPPINWRRSGKIWILTFAEITCPAVFEATRT
jgi:hypothetical protein